MVFDLALASVVVSRYCRKDGSVFHASAPRPRIKFPRWRKLAAARLVEHPDTAEHAHMTQNALAQADAACDVSTEAEGLAAG